MHVYRQLFCGASAFTFICVCKFALHGQSSGRLTLQDRLSFEPVGDHVLSPEGKTITLTRAVKPAPIPDAHKAENAPQSNGKQIDFQRRYIERAATLLEDGRAQ